MPLYEYQCGRCEKRFELLQKSSAPVTVACPACGASAQRVLSVSAIQFKGSGWYVTDYGRKAEPGQPEAGKPAPADKAEGKAAGESAKKEESKPAAPANKDST